MALPGGGDCRLGRSAAGRPRGRVPRGPAGRGGGGGSRRAAPELQTQGCPPPARPLGAAGSAGLPQEARGGTAPPRLASPHPPSVQWEGAEPQNPPLPPPASPRRGGPLQFVVTALHVRKKKVCRMSHTEKKIRNRAKKTCEWAWRMGLLKLRGAAAAPTPPASGRAAARRPPRPHGPPSR